MNESSDASELTDAELDAQADIGDFLNEEVCADEEVDSKSPSPMREVLDAMRIEMGMETFKKGMNYRLFSEEYFVNWIHYKGHKIGLMPGDCYALGSIDRDNHMMGEPGYREEGRWDVFVEDVLISEGIRGESRAFALAKRHIDS
jgi:hypothetical protein